MNENISEELERLKNNNSKELDELRQENENLRKDIKVRLQCIVVVEIMFEIQQCLIRVNGAGG